MCAAQCVFWSLEGEGQKDWEGCPRPSICSRGNRWQISSLSLRINNFLFWLLWKSPQDREEGRSNNKLVQKERESRRKCSPWRGCFAAVPPPRLPFSSSLASGRLCRNLCLFLEGRALELSLNLRVSWRVHFSLSGCPLWPMKKSCQKDKLEADKHSSCGAQCYPSIHP